MTKYRLKAFDGNETIFSYDFSYLFDAEQWKGVFNNMKIDSKIEQVEVWSMEQYNK